MRILVGTHNIANYVDNLAGGLRALGHEVITVETTPTKFYRRPDLMLGDVLGRSQTSAHEFILGFDVYIFVAAHSFLPGGLDLPLLRAHGKRIVAWLPGSECRHPLTAEPMWAAMGSRLPGIVKAGPERAARRMLAPNVYHNTLANKLHNVRMAERYADLVYGVPEVLGLGLRPFFSIPAPLDLSAFVPDIPGREVPVVVHAPSNRGFKQTELILATLERLRAEGVRFELRLLEGVPNHEVAQVLADADVLVDEMSLYPGILSHEGMASGCAVLTGNVPAALPLPEEKPPLHIEPANLCAQLRRVLTDRALRIELASQGRAYVKRHADREVVAEALVAKLVEGENAVPDCYPQFFFDTMVPPGDEPVPAYLRQMTLEILLRHGAPPDADLRRLVTVGLLPEGAPLEAIPRWATPLRQLGPWVRCRADIWSRPEAMTLACA